MGELLHLKWHPQSHFQRNDSIWGKITKAAILIAFAAGIFMANLMGREAVSNAGILNEYFIDKFKYTGVNGQNLFLYIFEQRMPLMLLLLILAFSSTGIVFGTLLLGWQGFSIGFMLSTAIAKYGAKGILLISGGLFPQYLFYIPIYFFYCYFTIFLRKRIAGTGGDSMVERERVRIYGIGVAVSMVLLLLFVTGIFLESYLNPLILKNILKLF